MKKHGTAKMLKSWVKGTLATALMLPWMVPAALASNTPLSLTQARSYIRGLELQISNQSLTLSGQIFSDCNGLFEIRSVSDSRHPNSFAILDKGGFATCMEAHASQDCAFEAADACISVSSDPLQVSGDRGEVHLVSTRDGQRNF
jgi:hypothetical protein